MSDQFRDLLKQVGSGSHTSKPLTRDQAALATRLMLTQEATPAQIGAFLIAHRIKRPVPEELAGMLDAYDQLGPRVGGIPRNPVTILGCPYDGRSRSVPVTAITALLLAARGQPVLLHGGDRMPTKEGLPLIEIWRHLGLSLDRLALDQVQALLGETNLGFLYQPRHFPEAETLVPYRQQIGKRPPVATLELMWSPYGGKCHTVVGYVHPPTEDFARDTFTLRGMGPLTTVKGVEGSCDLPRSRTAIIGLEQPDGSFERLLLHPRDYGYAGEEVALESDDQALEAIAAAIDGKPGELMRTAIWSGGFYLWRCGSCDSIEAGLAQAEESLKSGQVAAKLKLLQQQVQGMGTAAAQVS
ncbi:hypothetical protein C7271_14560 [filamentous cyanobacterium CCP5]|nr:hypothetical protein C7271_14560 [filamentous cyanobacterium CCP5]